MKEVEIGQSEPQFGMGRVYLNAAAEARRRGDRRVSTEHLVLALLVDPTRRWRGRLA